MTLSELRTQVQANWPDGFHSGKLTTAKINTFINDAQKWVCRGSVLLPGGVLNHNFSFLVTETEADTVDSQRRYDLPSSGTGILAFKADLNIELIDSEGYRRPLIKQHKKNIEDKTQFANTAGTGVPGYFCIEQGDIWLYPLPDHSYNAGNAFTINMEYYGYLTDLSGDDDENTLTEDNPEILIWKATAAGFRFGFDIDQAEYWENKSKERLIEMIYEDQDKTLSAIEEGMTPDDDQSLNYNT